jgi:hypothetical protein
MNQPSARILAATWTVNGPQDAVNADRRARTADHAGVTRRVRFRHPIAGIRLRHANGRITETAHRSPLARRGQDRSRQEKDQQTPADKSDHATKRLHQLLVL